MLLALATGVIAAMLQWVILRDGIRCNPDGWSYWQGAVTLMNGEGYRLFSGTEIIDWPPLYSIYLAMWQALFGISGATMLASTIVSTGVAAAAWLWMLSSAMKGSGTGLRWSSLFIAVMFAQATRHLMSESLANIFLPGLLGFAIRAARSERSRLFFGQAALAGVFGALLMLTRHASVTFLCGAGVLVLCNGRHGWIRRMQVAAVYSVVALLPAVICEAMMPAVASRTVELGIAKYGPFDYVLQACKGIGDRVLGSWPGFAAWLFVIHVTCSRRVAAEPRQTVQLCAVFTVVSLAVLYVLFNVTFINTQLKGRMVFFAPLVTVSVALLAVPAIAHRGLRITLLVLALAVPVGKTIKHVVKGRGADASLTDAEALADNFVRPHFVIELDHHDQPPIEREDGTVLVSPPSFPTHDALMEAHRANKK